MKKNRFVLVVCGGKGHIDSVHFSLRFLKHYSASEIVVVTDSLRNEIPIQHNNIIDVKTSDQFNHHQASIYLKTRLHHILPKGDLYCYLDSDIIALTQKIDSIFTKYHPPITFGADHCLLDEFSPFAVHCNCEFECKERVALLKKAILDCENLRSIYDNNLKEIDTRVELSKKERLSFLRESLKYHLPGEFYKLDSTYKLHKKDKIWYKNDNAVVYDKVSSCVEKKSGLIWEPTTEQWLKKDGSNAVDLKCNHLHAAVKERFGIDIPSGWQHWNGGVFLFDDQSHSFLDEWHKSTMKIFVDKKWKTRDQGTLAAIAWKFGLQDHPVLDPHYNFIADYYNKHMKYLGNLEFSTAKCVHVAPYFIHIYHHFGDTSWQVWRDIISLLKTHE
jgi:hypothetical protein